MSKKVFQDFQEVRFQRVIIDAITLEFVKLNIFYAGVPHRFGQACSCVFQVLADDF